MTSKGISQNKIIFMAVAIAIAAGVFMVIVSGIVHSFDALNAPPQQPEQTPAPSAHK